MLGRHQRPAPAASVSASDAAAIEQQARTQWARDPDLQREFGGRFEPYLAYWRAVARGQVRLFHRAG